MVRWEKDAKAGVERKEQIMPEKFQNKCCVGTPQCCIPLFLYVPNITVS